MVELKVCIGSSCFVNGGQNVARSFQHMIEENGMHDKINFTATFCMGKCATEGVSVMINDEKFRVDPESARSFFKDKVLPLAQ